MITRFKIYEKINLQSPKIGDYVITKSQQSGAIAIFTNNNIGQLKSIYKNDYRIKYNNIPSELKGNFDGEYRRGFDLRQIIHWSKNKEDLEIILQSEKYNL